MRPTAKISVCLVAISLGLLLALGNSASSEDAAQAKPSIKELQQKRLAILEKLGDVAQKLFSNARIEFEEVLSAKRALLAARVEYAETRKERIKACDDAIENAHELQQIAMARKAAARGSEIAVLKAQDFELEAQIARAKAEANP